jgi:Skp family chaperone for outer membrane proteins
MNKLQALSQKPLAALLILITLFFSACSETPERFFDIAILNTNMINDFASADLARHINDETKEFPDIPSSKKKGNEAATNLHNKILYLEQSLEKVKKLSASGDEEKEIKKLSQQLYELVIPVYKNEYLAYAKLCDSKGSQTAKDELIKNIDQKYGARFEQNFNGLMEKGKAYAQEHHIQVNWGQ